MGNCLSFFFLYSLFILLGLQIFFTSSPLSLSSSHLLILFSPPLDLSLPLLSSLSPLLSSDQEQAVGGSVTSGTATANDEVAASSSAIPVPA
mgnify:CR=1 FL=1